MPIDWNPTLGDRMSLCGTMAASRLAGANLNNNYVDGTCGACQGAVGPTYCMICTDYELTTSRVTDGTYASPQDTLTTVPKTAMTGRLDT